MTFRTIVVTVVLTVVGFFGFAVVVGVAFLASLPPTYSATSVAAIRWPSGIPLEKVRPAFIASLDSEILTDDSMRQRLRRIPVPEPRLSQLVHELRGNVKVRIQPQGSSVDYVTVTAFHDQSQAAEWAADQVVRAACAEAASAKTAGALRRGLEWASEQNARERRMSELRQSNAVDARNELAQLETEQGFANLSAFVGVVQLAGDFTEIIQAASAAPARPAYLTRAAVMAILAGLLGGAIGAAVGPLLGVRKPRPVQSPHVPSFQVPPPLPVGHP